MKFVKHDEIVASDFGLRGGGGSAKIKTLIEGCGTDIDNFAIYLQELDDTFFTPRHRHNFDQFRIALEQPYNIGPKSDLHPGEIAYFPEGAYYGPQNGTPGTVVLSLHFTGASRSRYINLPELTGGLRELKTRGVVANGVFTDTSPDGKKRNQDSYEAVWEHLEKTKMIYPKPRYTEPIIIRPEEFQWRESGNDVRTRHLGTFTEYQSAIRMHQIKPQGTLEVGMTRHRCVLVLLSGTIVQPGPEYGKYSCFLTGLAESLTLTASQNGATLIEFVLPDLNS